MTDAQTARDLERQAVEAAREALAANTRTRQAIEAAIITIDAERFALHEQLGTLARQRNALQDLLKGTAE